MDELLPAPAARMSGGNLTSIQEAGKRRESTGSSSLFLLASPVPRLTPLLCVAFGVSVCVRLPACVCVWQVNVLVPMQALSASMGYTAFLTASQGRTLLPSNTTGHWYALVSTSLEWCWGGGGGGGGGPSTPPPGTYW